MRKNNCEVIRRELDELMLDEACSAAALAHLKECSECREFQETADKVAADGRKSRHGRGAGGF